jgi:circadian clock protein KaiC
MWWYRLHFELDAQPACSTCRLASTSGSPKEPVEDRAATGVEGFDRLIEGGFPRGDLVLLAGHPGSGKTMFSSQFLYTGATKYGESGIYASFAENREAFLRNMRRANMDFESLEQKDLFRFIDFVTVKEQAIDAALATIMAEIDSLKARRLVIDSFSAMAQAFSEKIDARIVLHTVLGRMTRLSRVTTLLIAEKPLGSEALGGGMEEFVSDAVLVLTQSLERGYLRRYFDIVKMRGTGASRARLTYDITEHGIVVHPSLEAHPPIRVYSERVSTGVEGLDRMLSGGPYKGSTVLVMGEAGTGKTTTALQFMMRGVANKERTIYVSYEESQEELVRHALGFGWKINDHIENGLIKVASFFPEPYNIDNIFADTKKLIDEYKPTRFVFDSLTSLERAMNEDEFFRVVRRMESRFKAEGVTTLVTARTIDGGLPSDFWISSLMDIIVSLRQVESESALRRALVIFKARGLPHDASIKEFEIGPKGILVEEKFTDIEQILGGSARKPARVQAWSDAFSGTARPSKTGTRG